jgi:tight adherence protein B
MSIRIQRAVGGNLAELLDTVAETMRERERLRRHVSALSAEGRLSAWIVGALPVVFVVYLLLARPGYLTPLVTDPIGIVFLAGSVVLFAAGLAGLRWATKVEL